MHYKLADHLYVLDFWPEWQAEAKKCLAKGLNCRKGASAYLTNQIFNKFCDKSIDKDEYNQFVEQTAGKLTEKHKNYILKFNNQINKVMFYLTVKNKIWELQNQPVDLEQALELFKIEFVPGMPVDEFNETKKLFKHIWGIVEADLSGHKSGVKDNQ